VWQYLLLFGVALDGATTYFVLMRGFDELNPLAAWLIRTVGAAPAIVVVSAVSAAMGLLLLVSRLHVFRAIGVAYAATRWIPGAHNLALLRGVPLDPAATLMAQYSAMLAIYIYFLAQYYRRGALRCAAGGAQGRRLGLRVARVAARFSAALARRSSVHKEEGTGGGLARATPEPATEEGERSNPQAR